MEKNLKITDVKTITKDGQLYVEYATVSSDGQKVAHERPMYNDKGEVDPEVKALLELAKKMDEKTVLVDNAEELEENSEKETEEVAQTKDNGVAIIPVNKGTVTVYQQPENATIEKEGFFARNKRLIVVGLACLLVGVVITKACDNKTEKPKEQETSKDDNAITDVSEEAKIKYVTKEEFLNGANVFNSYLKEKINGNYSANDLYSFYYMANFENVSTDLFKELISEGYLPDNDAGILSNALKITTVVSDANVRTGVSSVDYSQLFIDKQAIEKANYWQTKYNSMKDATKEDCEKVVAELENYWVVSNEDRANNLPVGAEEIIGLTEGVSITIQAASKGIQPSDALMAGVTDISSIYSVINHKLDCIVVDEAEKQLTK